ncbi:MAG TPA: ribosome silencing factor [Candidatus Angelobacter sp.]|nr:ribosome silencing factor [Candidatus Angelobacter sp.]
MIPIRRQVAQAVRAVESKKGEDIVILEMDKASGAFTDYFVVCTGTNPRQVQAISDEITRTLGPAGVRPNNIEGYNQAEWVLLDYVDFVVHIFSERARHFYDLERLWKSARRQSLTSLEKEPAAKKAAKPAARKKIAVTKKVQKKTSNAKKIVRPAKSKPATRRRSGAKVTGKKKRKAS